MLGCILESMHLTWYGWQRPGFSHGTTQIPAERWESRSFRCI